MSTKLKIGDKEVSLEKIKKLYETDGKSWKEIANMYNTYPNKIARFANKNGIKNRSRGESQKMLFDRGIKESPTKGKKRSKAVKEKISKSQAKVWDNLSEKELKERKQRAKDIWDSKPLSEKQELRKAATRGILEAAEKGSKIEQYVQNALRDAGYIIEAHKEDLLPVGKTHIDIFLPTLMTAIEIDGPAHFLPIWGQDKLDHHIQKDAIKNARITSGGFTLIRVKYMISSSSLAKMRYVSEEILKKLEDIQQDPAKYKKQLIEIEVN